MNQSFRVGQAFFPANPAGVGNKRTSAPSAAKPFHDWFQDSLRKEAGKTDAPRLSFSQHALQRLETRGIVLSERDLARLEGAVKKAADKGARESLIVMDNVAYVVSVVNRKVITAVDEANMKENVFTNIDSAVWV